MLTSRGIGWGEIMDMPMPTFKWLVSAAQVATGIDRATSMRDTFIATHYTDKTLNAEINQLLPKRGRA